MTYARETSVPVQRSQQEVENLVRKHGAKAFYRGDNDGKAMVGFALKDRRILFELPLPEPKEFATIKRHGRTVKATPAQVEAMVEQASRTRWRALALAIKAKLVSVESGVESFDEAFLAQIVVAQEGKAMRFGALAIDAINGSYKNGRMPPLLGAGGES